MYVTDNHNQSKEQVVEVLRLLFRGARKCVTLSTSLTADLLDQLAPDIQKCIDTVESFNVILDSRVNLDWVKTKHPWLFSSAKVHISQAPEPIPHWILIDDRDFRLEKTHPFPAMEGPAGPEWFNRDNRTIFDADPEVAKAIDAQFKAFSAKARIIKP